jgi:hypothetical protein
MDKLEESAGSYRSHHSDIAKPNIARVSLVSVSHAKARKPTGSQRHEDDVSLHFSDSMVQMSARIGHASQHVPGFVCKSLLGFT